MPNDNNVVPYTYQQIPKLMQDIPHWILWRKEWLEEKQKWSKIPIQINGYGASVTNPAHYSSFADANTAYMLGTGDGIGFCFNGQENLVFMDFDGAISDGAWNPEHLAIMQQTATWGELSMSGKGTHLICQGTLDRTRTHNPAGLELYASGRFVAMTGWSLDGWPTDITPQQPAIDALAVHIDSLKKSTAMVQYDEEPAPDLVNPLVLEGLKISKHVYEFLTQGIADKWDSDRSRAMLAASMSLYRTGASDAEVLSTMWAYCGHIAQEHRPVGNALDWLWKYSVSPGQGGRPPDADTLFAAIPTADVDRLQELLGMVSQLECGSVTDTKTIHQARSLLAESLRLDAGSRIAIQDAVRKAMTWTKSDTTVVLKELQREARRQGLDGHGGIEMLTDGYLYIASMHAFLHKESGEILKPEAFVALHSHISDEIRDIVLSGEGVAKVTTVDFDPGQPEFFVRDGATIYNTWRGLASVGVAGDIAPWWQHLCLLVPEEREREHLLNWLSFTLQFPQHKINHCIVFGGHYGVGKDTLFWPLDKALGRHSKQVGGDALTRDFNEYLTEAKLVTLQEVEMGSHREAKVIDNRLKPMIAAPPDTLHINVKGISGYHVKNVVHLILFHNGQHPVIINEGDRRYFVLNTDLRVTDPGTGEQRPQWQQYFNQLWAWMDQGQGWQAVVHYLLSRDVSRFNPKAAPPMTEGKADIIEESKSGLERLIAATIEERTGPFAMDVATADDFVLWLSTEAIGMIQAYDLREVPSPITVGKALKAAGCISRRVRIKRHQSHVWSCRNHEYWSGASSIQLLAGMTYAFKT